MLFDVKSENKTVEHFLSCFMRLNKEKIRIFMAKDAKKGLKPRTERLTKAKNKRKHQYSLNKVERFDD